MQIDRSNYEILIIDWLDGNLNSSQVAQLNLFLDQNPDLREEFNDLTQQKLISPVIPFQKKEQLKKSPSAISQSQFEYLCAAYLENDLTISQKEEIEEIIKNSPDRKKTFEKIQKTIIVPERIAFKHKKLLLKRTTNEKVIWLSVKSLSIAAAISLIVVVYSVLHPAASSKLKNSAQSLVTDTTLQATSSEVGRNNQLKESRTESYGKKSLSRPVRITRQNNAINTNSNTIARSTVPFVLTREEMDIPIEKVPVRSQVDLRNEIAGKALVQTNPKSDLTAAVNEKSHKGKSISKTFREKFLKIKTQDETPVKGYEIAEAGVSGLNKLFGWQMALDMKKDENGQPKSVIFSSAILKIQAPVKKKEPQP